MPGPGIFLFVKIIIIPLCHCIFEGLRMLEDLQKFAHMSDLAKSSIMIGLGCGQGAP